MTSRKRPADSTTLNAETKKSKPTTPEVLDWKTVRSDIAPGAKLTLVDDTDLPACGKPRGVVVHVKQVFDEQIVARVGMYDVSVTRVPFPRPYEMIIEGDVPSDQLLGWRLESKESVSHVKRMMKMRESMGGDAYYSRLMSHIWIGDHATLLAQPPKPAAQKSRPRPVPSGTYPSSGRVYLNVPYAEKDEAKIYGAKWDAERRKWYSPCGLNPGLEKWCM